MKRKIIFQALDWRLKDIKNNLEEIKKAGFNTIQTSPLQGIKENNGHFWIYYQPTNYKIGNSLGSREELKELIRTTPFLTIGKKYGVCDNAIRKWCIRYDLPTKKKDINAYSNEEWLNV